MGFRYSLEYHVQNGLLSTDNLNIDCLGDLASVLHEYEPNNFLFIHVLQSGYFHKICDGYTKLKGDHNSKLKKDILNKLLLSLCHIFELHPIPIAYKAPQSAKGYLWKSNLSLPKNETIEIMQKMTDKYWFNFASHYYNLYKKTFDFVPTEVFGEENIVHFIKYCCKYGDGGIFGHNQVFFEDFRGRKMTANGYVFDFHMHENYARIVDEASLRDGLAWQKLKKFQLLLEIIDKSMENISSLKSKQEAMNEAVKVKIEEFENGLEKLRQHKFSIYRRQQQFWMDEDKKLWKKWEIEAQKKRLRLQAIGDDFVMALQDLRRDFRQKFKSIVPIGPISNYNQIISNQMNTASAVTAESSPDAKKKTSAEKPNIN